MKCLLIIATFLATLHLQANCKKPTVKDPVLYLNEFPWGQNLEQMGELFEKIYNSESRLKDRFYFDGEGYKTDLETPYGVKKISVPQNFLDSVNTHIEKALKRGYVDYIFMPDMGHSHYFVPSDLYKEAVTDVPLEEVSRVYENLMNMKDLKILYHTAEQLKVRDDNDELLKDPHIMWRYMTRNLVGSNDTLPVLDLLHNTESDKNTSHDYDPNYTYYGAGYYISSNKNGCFTYKKGDKTYNYDITFSEYPYNEDLTPSADVYF